MRCSRMKTSLMPDAKSAGSGASTATATGWSPVQTNNMVVYGHVGATTKMADHQDEIFGHHDGAQPVQAHVRVDCGSASICLTRVESIT